MIRKLVFITAILMVFITTRVMALGLGDLTLHSSLNEPLSAEIELLSVQADELDGIKVAMASQRDFELIGVERLYFLTTLKFSTKINKAGKAVIFITTKDPIKEPFLDFVIEVNWAKGRMLREYTTLVDPPAFTQEAPAPVKQAATKPKQSVVRSSAPEAAPATPATAAEPKVAEEEVLFPNIAIEEDVSVPDTYGPTKRTDTLWSIAQKVRPNSKVSTDQVMQALLKKNPEAFYNSNINDLKAGHVLRIPDLEEVTALSKREASQLSRAQYQDWKAAKSKSTHIDTSAPGEGGQMMLDQAGSSDETGPRLKLLSPEEEAELMAKTEESQAGSGSAMQDSGTGVTNEESEALRARVSELESQLSEMEKTLAIKDDALAGFQKEMQVKPAITAQPVQKPETEVMAEAKKPKPVPAVKQKSKPKPAVSRTLVDDILDSPLMLAGIIAIVVILGALIWMVIGKRRVTDMRMNFQESILTGGETTSSATENTLAPEPKQPVEPEHKRGDSSFLSEFSVSGIEGIQTEVAEVDPVAEADVYMAYGGFTQAEDLIKDALNNDPARPELKLKLLDIYHHTKNADAFQACAEEFYASLGGESNALWDKVVVMGRTLCPDNSLFGTDDVTDTASDEDEVPLPLMSDGEGLSDMKMDSDLDMDLPMDVPEDMPDESDVSGESDLDLSDESDLDLDLDTDAEETTELGLGESVLDEEVSADIMPPEDTGLDESTETGLDDSLSQDSESVSDEDNTLDLDMSELEASLEDTPDEELSDMTFEDSITADDLDLDSSQDEESTKPITAFEDSAVDGGLYTEEDEIGTKLDLAKAYIDMGDPDGAKSILEEVLEEGSDTQQHEARDLMNQMQE